MKIKNVLKSQQEYLYDILSIYKVSTFVLQILPTKMST